MFRLLCVMGSVLCAAVCVAQPPPASPPPTPATPPPMASIGKATAKKTYASVTAILEELPRKPEPGDNWLAPIADREWLRTKVPGNSLQVSGTVCSLQSLSPVRSLGEQAHVQVHITLAEQLETWRHCAFTSHIGATFDLAGNDLTKVQPGDNVIVKGNVAQILVEWKSEGYRPTPTANGRRMLPLNGRIDLLLQDCKLVAENGPTIENKPAAVGEAPTSGAPWLPVQTPPAIFEDVKGGTRFRGSGEHFRIAPTPAASERPEERMETVSTSAKDMEIRRMKVPGGWLVFTKWHMSEASGTPSHTETMCVFCPDPGNRWSVGSTSASGRTEKRDERLGKQPTPTPPLWPLGAGLTVDKNGIIWENGKAVGTWGVETAIESGIPSSSKPTVVPQLQPVPRR